VPPSWGPSYRQYAPLKRRSTSRLHGTVYQKLVLCMLSNVHETLWVHLTIGHDILSHSQWFFFFQTPRSIQDTVQERNSMKHGPILFIISKHLPIFFVSGVLEPLKFQRALTSTVLLTRRAHARLSACPVRGEARNIDFIFFGVVLIV
jgi:hypothetical protein